MYATGRESVEGALDREVYGRQPAVARCAFCPDFVVSGPAAEVMEAGAEHRARVHPDLKVKRVRGGRGRACIVGLCERRASVRQGRFAGYCGPCRDVVVADEKLKEREERNRQRELERARREENAIAERVRREDERARERSARASVHGPARKRGPAKGTNPRVLATPEIMDEMVRLYQEGYSAIAIARMRWQEWGYASEVSLTASVYNALDQRQVPRRSRGESLKMTIEREGTRPGNYGGGSPSLLNDERIAVVEKLVGAGCSVSSVARIAWKPWGYKSDLSCRDAIKRQASLRGSKLNGRSMREIPLVAREDAEQMILDAARQVD